MLFLSWLTQNKCVCSSVPCLACVFLHSLNKSSECLLCADILLHADIKLLWGKNKYGNTFYKGDEIPQYQVMEGGARGGAGKSLETDRPACLQSGHTRGEPLHWHPMALSLWSSKCLQNLLCAQNTNPRCTKFKYTFLKSDLLLPGQQRLNLRGLPFVSNNDSLKMPWN